MKIGSIWFHKNFPFEDSSKGKKLIVIVGQKNDTHLMCKTTSQESTYRQRDEGCFDSKGYYMIFANNDWFTKDTWIQFDIIYQFKITEISKDITSKGDLKPSTKRDMLECILKSEDVGQEYLDIIRSNIKKI